MKESRILQISPAEVAEAAHFDLAKRLLEDERPVTTAEISRYADGIITVLKKLKNASEKKSFLEKIIGLFKEEKQLPRHTVVVKRMLDQEPSEAEHKQVLDRIRMALLENLKDKLTRDAELGEIDYSDVNLVSSFAKDTFHLEKIINLNRGKKLLRHTPESFFYSSSEMKIHGEALKKLASIPQNPHIIEVERYNPEQRKSTVKELDLKNISEILLSEEMDLSGVLSIVKDCLDGAEYLEQNGLVLEDIAVPNLGSVSEGGKTSGILFDLDGLYILGAKQETRIGRKRYLPQWTSSEVSSAEMVFQFGLCLREILNKFIFQNRSISEVDMVEEEIYALVSAMTVFNEESKNPFENRVSLTEAKNRLEKIISTLTQP